MHLKRLLQLPLATLKNNSSNNSSQLPHKIQTSALKLQQPCYAFIQQHAKKYIDICKLTQLHFNLQYDLLMMQQDFTDFKHMQSILSKVNEYTDGGWWFLQDLHGAICHFVHSAVLSLSWPIKCNLDGLKVILLGLIKPGRYDQAGATFGSYNSIATYYVRLGKYKHALKYLKIAAKLYYHNQQCSKSRKSTICAGMITCYSQLHNINQVKKWKVKANKIPNQKDILMAMAYWEDARTKTIGKTPNYDILLTYFNINHPSFIILKNIVRLACCAKCGTFKCKLYACSKCRLAYYCSKKHQKKDWKSHKLVCGQFSIQQCLQKVSIFFDKWT